MGDLLQQMAVTFVTHEVEAAREAERRQTGQEAAEAEAARRPKRNVLLEKQLSLLAKMQRSVRQETQQ